MQDAEDSILAHMRPMAQATCVHGFENIFSNRSRVNETGLDAGLSPQADASLCLCRSIAFTSALL